MLKMMMGVAVAGVFVCGAECVAGEPAREIAVGEWSESVADTRGYAVRGRLVLTEKVVSEERREVGVYVELQDASEHVGGGMRIFCDLGKTDLSGETKAGLECELKDSEGKVVAGSGFPFSGGVPSSEWISLPSDATIRLRASPFGIHRAGARAIAANAGTMWVIEDGDPREYFLSGTFTVDPEEGRREVHDPHIWRGRLVLPAARITGRDGVSSREAGQSEAARMVGRWELVQAFSNGMPVSQRTEGPNVVRQEFWEISREGVQRRIELRENGKKAELKSGTEFRIVRADDEKAPHELDLKVLGGNGTPAPIEGKVMPMIFSVEGDSLVICMSIGEERPAEFSAEKGSGRVLTIFRRVPEGEK